MDEDELLLFLRDRQIDSKPVSIAVKHDNNSLTTVLTGHQYVTFPCNWPLSKIPLYHYFRTTTKEAIQLVSVSALLLLQWKKTMTVPECITDPFISCYSPIAAHQTRFSARPSFFICACRLENIDPRVEDTADVWAWNFGTIIFTTFMSAPLVLKLFNFIVLLFGSYCLSRQNLNWKGSEAFVFVKELLKSWVCL